MNIKLADGIHYYYKGVSFAENSGDAKHVHILVMDIAENPDIRLVALYDGAWRYMEKGNESWLNVYGKEMGAVAMMSGTFSSYYYPLGDIVGYPKNFELTNQHTGTSYDGKQIPMRQFCRCFVGQRKKGDFRVGAFPLTVEFPSIVAAYRSLMGGGGFLVYHRKNAVPVSHNRWDSLTTVDGVALAGQDFKRGSDSPYDKTWHTAFAVSADGKQLAFLLTEERYAQGKVGWTMEELSELIRGNTYIPNSSSKMKFPVDGYNACFMDGGGVAELLIPIFAPNERKMPRCREWDKPGNRREERKQVCCWAVLPKPAGVN